MAGSNYRVTLISRATRERRLPDFFFVSTLQTDSPSAAAASINDIPN